MGPQPSQHGQDSQHGHRDSDGDPQHAGEGGEWLRRQGCVLHVVMDPFGEIGDAGIDRRVHRVHAPTAPAHYANLQPGVVEFTDEWTPRVALEEKKVFP